MSEKSKLVICPYCGHTQTNKDRCENCNGYFEPLSRMATQIAMGPWYVRDANQPFRPGCSMDVIRKQIKSGKIKANTVVRGPTTRQFWTVARFVPGIAHLLGYCDACSAHVDPGDLRCHGCGHSFLVHDDRNDMGLQYATDEAAEKAERLLEEKMRLGSLEKKADRTKSAKKKKKTSAQDSPADAAKPAVGGDLLDQIIGSSSFATATAAGSSGIGDSFEHGSDLLEFERQPEMDSTSEPSPSPAAANAAALAAAAPAQPTGPLPQKSNKTMVILLVVTNVIMLAGVVLFAIYMISQQNQAPTPTPTPTPPVQDPGSSGSASLAPRVDHRVVFTPPRTPVFDPRANPNPAPPATDPGTRPATEPGTTPVTQLNVYLLDEARVALNATPPDNSRALQLLQRYKASTPADHQWRGVDEEIARLEAELNPSDTGPRTIFDFDP